MVCAASAGTLWCYENFVPSQQAVASKVDDRRFVLHA